MTFQNPLQALLDKQNRRAYRRLPFPDKCAWYAALRLGALPSTVGKAADLSAMSVYFLNHAGEIIGGHPRYMDVAAEFERLGLEAFTARYVLLGHRNALLRAQAELAAGDRRKPRGTADVRRHERCHIFKSCFDTITQVEVAHDDDGWKWRDISPDDVFGWRGDPRNGEAAFAAVPPILDFLRLRFAFTLDEANSQAYYDASSDEAAEKKRLLSPLKTS